MKIILKEDQDAEDFFDQLINRAVQRATHQFRDTLEDFTRKIEKPKDKWVSTEEAKKILGVKSKNKMQQLRDESPLNGIIVSQHGRTYRYFEPSLYKFLEKNKLT